MIRVLAASLSAAALIAGSLPAEAQQRQQGASFRAPSQNSLAGRRLSGPKQLAGQRRFRSFNPPAPQIASGQRSYRSFNPPAPIGQAANPPRAFSRGLAPPSPGGTTAPRIFYPDAPAGGQNFAANPGSVPASLPPPSPGETSPTAAPAASPTEAVPQGDLQPPIPESVTAQSEPAATADKADKVVPEQVVQQVVQVPVPQVVRHECEARVVYVPVYRERRIYHRHHVHAPYYAFRGHRVHFGHRAHFRFRRW